MTNEEIIQSVRSKYVTKGQVTMYTTEQIGFMLNMLRDELSNTTEQTLTKMSGEELDKYLDGKRALFRLRGVIAEMELDEIRGEKEPEGVDVWVSVDRGNCFYETHEIWHGSPPTLDRKGYYQGEHGSNIRERLATVLGISKGECAKFKIVRQP